MNSPSLFRGLAVAGLSLTLSACGPQEEPSSLAGDGVGAGAGSIESRHTGPRQSPDEARAVAPAEAAPNGGVTHDVLGITYVRPHDVRPLRAYAVPVTADERDGLPVDEIVYVDVNDGSVLLKVARGEAGRPADTTRLP